LWVVGIFTPRNFDWPCEGDSRQPKSGGGTLQLTASLVLVRLDCSSRGPCFGPPSSHETASQGWLPQGGSQGTAALHWWAAERGPDMGQHCSAAAKGVALAKATFGAGWGCEVCVLVLAPSPRCTPCCYHESPKLQGYGLSLARLVISCPTVHATTHEPTLVPSMSISTKLGAGFCVTVLYAPVADPGLITNRSSYL
jgi:hypothetical protein